ncbi:aminomethyl-transferring glycine dehydrogenase [Apibacter sp. HY039]|uniref:aminomethyl-transferring glycine dehydrogenase n=1 Tax=Apibacter sp. HY039 TaxID=2501476 RepID=UPI000FEBAE0E|nr:aminomethyl-transferring glycine dehydrogenase [Apibacter sp. HY039]
MNTSDFSIRHIGINEDSLQIILKELKTETVQELIEQTLPKDILGQDKLNLPKALSEYDMLLLSKNLAGKNKVFSSYIGFGYSGTITPSPILRNIFENPGWYTAYTPYQAEISQGRLEALLNFQTVISDLTGFSLTNASLLDEGTAAAEALHMLYEARNKSKKDSNKFFVSEEVYPQTIAVVKTKAMGLGIEIVVGSHQEFTFDSSFFGALLQYPAKHGEIFDYSDFISQAKDGFIRTVLAADILALAVLKNPAELGADVAIGSTQRFGVPLGFGGPSAAYFACKDEFKRSIPGRIIGVSKDKHGNRALRMSLQTREQHIKREKATSNICTAQVLLAVMAGMYAVYHGSEGLKSIASDIHLKAILLKEHLSSIGFNVSEEPFFDTIKIYVTEEDKTELKKLFEALQINLNYFSQGIVSISLDETVSDERFAILLSLFLKFKNTEFKKLSAPIEPNIPDNLIRNSDFLTHEVFKKYHTETEFMRYVKRLEKKDIALNYSMISLGSCTMKLNAATEMLPLSWMEWNAIHPFVPKDQSEGYLTMLSELETYLAEITGFAGTSLQPNSGAQGEYAGLMVIREYLKAKGEGHRNIALIPQSAHGTNPASAVMAGLKVIVVKNLDNGEFDIEDLKQKAELHKDHLAAVMITYPSTYGFFDTNVKEIIAIVHQAGGQVYMDGANMNAQVAYTSPGYIGADVCHLNLHKTFAIPHGGGGPGIGPICVAEHLLPYLPTIKAPHNEENRLSFSSSPYGSAMVATISYAYIRMLGYEGLKKATATAILNANYLKEKLASHYEILYTNKHGRVGHELIVDFRPFKNLGIEVGDIAKRLMDYGFHAPTVSFPVAGTLMIEPTESESLEELNRFAEALISIKQEIDEIADGTYTIEDCVIKNAPHTLEELTSNEWHHSYSRQKAAYPLNWIAEKKFWTSVGKIDDAFGDRNLICTCNPIEDYEN